MSTVVKRKFTIVLTATVHDDHNDEPRSMPVKVAIEAEDEFQAIGILEASLRRIALGPF